jgi:tetratricopeptide (TPR) repeat protein
LAAIVLPDRHRVSVPQGDGQENRGRITESHRRLVEADKLCESGQVDQAWKIVDRELTYGDPDNVLALNIAQKLWFKQRKLSVAYQYARRAADLAPERSFVWANLGMLEEQLYRFDAAERCFRKAELLAKDDDAKGGLYINWGCMLVQAGRWKEAEEVARKALALRPDSPKAKANLGLACLALGKWKEGWPLYDAIIGFDQSRKKQQYANEKPWDGKPNKRLVIYGEQGLGDEISFGSMIPDAIARSKSVVIDCSPKLLGLYKRSFPAATVYGTRWDNDLSWDPKDTQIDASISVGGLGKFLRPDPSSCSGEPYLIPDPDRVEMWKALFKKQGKPVIGIAWSGGVAWTGDRNRKWSLEELLPIFKAVDAVWVSLEYKDAASEIARFREKHPEIDLRQYAFGTLTDDYDDTAALVSALDHVVAMQTSVIHLAGALGKPCDCFVNKHGQWRYGVNGTSMPWYKSVRLWRNVDGWPIVDCAEDLGAKFANPAA